VIPTGACLRCGRERPLFGRVAGGRICRACYDIAHAKVCIDCGELRPANNRDDDGRPICNGCAGRRHRRRAEAEERAEVVAAVMTVFPETDVSAVASALAGAAVDRPRLRALGAHLRHHPEALKAGPNTTLPVLERLVVALGALGLGVEATHPICERCGRARRRHTRTPTGGVCASCQTGNHKLACATCGRYRRVDHRDAAGQPVCAVCTQAAKRQAQLMATNAEIIEVVQRLCPQTSPTACAGAIEDVAKNVPERARLARQVAEAPDLAIRLHRPVLLARFLAELRFRGIALAAPACEDCGGNAEPLITYMSIVRCRACARLCPGCGRSVKEINKPLCSVCETDSARGDCVTCGARCLRDEFGHCHRCRQREQRRCARCDSAGPRSWVSESWLCGPCALRAFFDAVIAPAERLPPVLVPIRDAVLAAGNWRTARAWLARSTGGQLLGRLARGELAITHEALDGASPGPDKSVEHLRAMLVSAEALPIAPERELEAFEDHVATRLSQAQIDPADAKVVRAWIRWEVLPALRARNDPGFRGSHALNRCRANLVAVIVLLEKLSERERHLGSMTQADMDEWFSQPGQRAWRMRAFLTWAASRRYLRAGMAPPPCPHKGLLSPIDHEARWAIARRLVIDDTISVERRVAAGLVVLYGQTMARIALLTTEDVHKGADGSVIVVLGGNPMPIHEPFASLISGLPVRRTNGVSDQIQTRHWLFPGRRAGTPTNPQMLAVWMKELGIEPRAMRNTARAQLAGEIPAGMLAEVIGIDAGTATRWTAIANGNWTAYAAGRAR